jgi:two-component system LytT family response regulator
MNKTWKTLIIDDERLARKRLARLLKPYEHIDIIGEAVDGQDGLEKIEHLKPELIFLDIEMPVFNGFEMLSKLKHQPKVVFITAYDQYAIKAFEEDSIDYLLKPLEINRLEKTIEKLNRTQHQPTPYLPLQTLIEQLRVKKDIQTLTVKIGDKIFLIKLDRIIYLEADEKYVILYTTDGKKHVTDYTIASLEKKLPEVFVSVRRGTIINCDHIKEIRKGFNGTFKFIMNNYENTSISSSRSNGERLRERFGI